jgi:hypothetical protein
MAWAKDYRGEQIHQSNRLYEYIAESTTGTRLLLSLPILAQPEEKADGMAGPDTHATPRHLPGPGGGGKGFVRLQVLENLYYILEELSFPPPKGFTSEFATLGHKYLPRSVFMQYMARTTHHHPLLLAPPPHHTPKSPPVTRRVQLTRACVCVCTVYAGFV